MMIFLEVKCRAVPWPCMDLITVFRVIFKIIYCVLVTNAVRSRTAFITVLAVVKVLKGKIDARNSLYRIYLRSGGKESL